MPTTEPAAPLTELSPPPGRLRLSWQRRYHHPRHRRQLLDRSQLRAQNLHP